MRAKRVFTLLGPGLVASLALSPGVAAAGSATPAPAQVAAAAPSISGHFGQADPPAPYPSGYDNGYKAGKAAGEAGRPRSAIPIPPAAGHTVGQGQYYTGFADGYEAHQSVEEFAVSQSTTAASQGYVTQKQKELERKLEREGVVVAPLPKDQPVLPASSTPTHQTAPGTAPQGQDTGSQGITKPTTPTHQPGQETAPQGQHTGSQGITEPTTPTRETLQETAPQGQDTGWQGMTESSPSEWGQWETAPQGQDTGWQGMTESGPSEWGGWG